MRSSAIESLPILDGHVMTTVENIDWLSSEAGWHLRNSGRGICKSQIGPQFR
jgi:hypothetical protein